MGRIKYLNPIQGDNEEDYEIGEGIEEDSSLSPLTDSSIHRLYFYWLIDPLNEWIGKKYVILFTKLHATDFTQFVPNDDNRAKDGEALRQQFIESQGLGLYEWSILYKQPCSVLEMLIGVSMRMDEIMSEMDDTRCVSKWFWELIENLDLKIYSDERYYVMGGPAFVNSIIRNFLDRNYTREGNGGLFPLRRSRRDQRKVEIWYQMNEYLQERYNIDGGMV